MTNAWLAPSLVVLLATACTAPRPAPNPVFPQGELVDLSHPYDATTIFWPTSDPFRLEKVAEGMTAGGYFYSANNFCMAEHGGTHLDAPVHFAANRQAADQIPLDSLIGPAIVIDVAAQADRNPDYQVTTADFERWESDHGPMPPDTIVLLRTGFSARWPDARRYLGTDERGAAAVPKLHFPGLHPDGAMWLATSRRIKAVGIDTASIDFGQSSLFETHRLLTDRDIPVFENLTALERVPALGAVVIALPMKIANGSGGPLRAVAVLPSP